MYRIKHHLLNMYVITKYLIQLRKQQYLKRSIYFCVKLLLTIYHLSLLVPILTCTSISKAWIIYFRK